MIQNKYLTTPSNILENTAFKFDYDAYNFCHYCPTNEQLERTYVYKKTKYNKFICLGCNHEYICEGITALCYIVTTIKL